MKQPFTVYRTIRIDGQFDTEKTETAEEAIDIAVTKVIDDALAHTHTVENGVEISDIINCGEPN